MKLHRARRASWTQRPSLAALALLAGLGCVPVALTGCAPGTSTISASAVSQAIADARTVIGAATPLPTGLTGVYATVKSLYPSAISAADDAQVQALLGSAPGILDSLSASADAAVTAGGLRGIESIATGVLNIVASSLRDVPGVPPDVLLGLQAAAVLLPVIEATANTLVPQPPTVGAAPARFRSSMTVGQARAVLAR